MGTLRYSLPSDFLSTPTVTVQAGTADTGYGPEWLTNFVGDGLARPSRSISNASIAYQLDFGSAVTLAGMLFWHSTDAGSNITIAANSAASWGAPPFSTTVTALTKLGSGRSVKLWKALNQTYRYWLITLPSNASLQPGLKVQPYTSVRSLTGLGLNGNAGKTFQWGARRASAQFGTDHATEFNVHWSYPFVGAGADSETGPLALSDADIVALRFWHAATGGRTPTLFVPDSASAEAWLAKIALGPAPTTITTGAYVSRFDAQMVAPNYNVVTLTVEDVSAGGPEWS